MSILLVERDAKGHIAKMAQKISPAENLFALAAGLVLFACGVSSAYIDLAGDWSNHSHAKLASVDVLIAGLGLVWVAFIAPRLLPNHSPVIPYASPEGMTFRHFPKAGLVRWDEITGFRKATVNKFFFGRDALIATIRDPQRWAAPEKSYLPSGTIAGSARIDLDALKAVLEKMRAQQTGAPIVTAQTLSPQADPAKIRNRATTIMALVTLLLFVLVGIFHSLIRYGLSLPPWAQYATPDAILIYALIIWALIYRLRRRTAADEKAT